MSSPSRGVLVGAVIALAGIALAIVMLGGSGDGAPEASTEPAEAALADPEPEPSIERHPALASDAGPTTIAAPDPIAPAEPLLSSIGEELEPGEIGIGPGEPPPELPPITEEDRREQEPMAPETVRQRTERAISLVQLSTARSEEEQRAALAAGDGERARILGLRIERQRARADSLRADLETAEREAGEDEPVAGEDEP